MPRAVRFLLPLTVLAAVTATVAPAGAAPPAPARPAPAAVVPLTTPVADNDALYAQCGRVFPDPLAFGPAPVAAPGESPWAKGNRVCRATDFIQYTEALSGLAYLESKFPDFVEVYNLREDFADVLDVEKGEGQSAGLPNSLLGRDKSDLYMVRVTDERVPEKDKKKFLFTLSLHGIEKAGLEGGLRAVEDLATWGATTPEQPVMETLDDSLPTGEVLRRSEAWFALNNPDGWRRGDTTAGGVSYQRYNGNGVDLNRDWPEKGFTYRPYTPASEPETATFRKVLKHISPKWAGGVDLHGQLVDRAFSFTLLGASQRKYDKNQRMLQFTRGAYQDAESRLAWNPIIKPNDAPEACVPPGTSGTVNEPPDCDATPRVYGVQFGSIWDTIAYTVTGAIGNWGDSDLGLDADFIDNEMSLSHLSNCGIGKCFVQSAEQLHVDGNKSLIYAMLNFALLPEDTLFKHTGRVGWLSHDKRVKRGAKAAPPKTGLPLQDPITTQLTKVPGEEPTFEFDVLPDSAKRANDGLKAVATFSNVQGVGPGALLGIAVDVLNAEEPEPDGSMWTTVNQDYNQSPVYLQSGMQVDANDLKPGRYRVRVTGEGAGLVGITITFTDGRAWPDPGQLPYDVQNLDFFRELTPFVRKDSLVEVPTASVKAGSVDLQQFDTLVAVDGTLTDPAVVARLKAFAEKGGNVVLTDDAMVALEGMGIVEEGSVEPSMVYAGSVSFQPPAESDDPYGDPLAAGAHEPGAAEGPNNRKQTTEPVPIGYSINTPDGGDASTLPQHGVDPAAWADAGGRVVGLTGDGNSGDVTLGEVPLGAGRVRVLGSLLPVPTQEFDHPFGLASYSITPVAYELLKNLLSFSAPNRTAPSGTGAPVQQPPAAPPVAQPPGNPTLPTTGLPLAAAGLGALALAASLVVRRRRAHA
jgi:hypothetical protein